MKLKLAFSQTTGEKQELASYVKELQTALQGMELQQDRIVNGSGGEGKPKEGNRGRFWWKTMGSPNLAVLHRRDASRSPLQRNGHVRGNSDPLPLLLSKKATMMMSRPPYIFCRTQSSGNSHLNDGIMITTPVNSQQAALVKPVPRRSGETGALSYHDQQGHPYYDDYFSSLLPSPKEDPRQGTAETSSSSDAGSRYFLPVLHHDNFDDEEWTDCSILSPFLLALGSDDSKIDMAGGENDDGTLTTVGGRGVYEDEEDDDDYGDDSGVDHSCLPTASLPPIMGQERTKGQKGQPPIKNSNNDIDRWNAIARPVPLEIRIQVFRCSNSAKTGRSSCSSTPTNFLVPPAVIRIPCKGLESSLPATMLRHDSNSSAFVCARMEL